jgi:hypothetical protein
MAMAAALISTAFQPGPIEGLEPAQNPLGAEGADAILWLLDAVASVVFLALLAAAAWSLLQRWRRAQGDERSQLKWFAYAAGVLVTVLVLIETVLAASKVAGALIVPGLLSLPIAVGVAVLRYRLYEIDRLINRTLVYGLATATLGLAYAAMVLAGGQLFGGIGGKPPSWTVAGATLAVAGLFQPARHRIQQAVDRRFNRRRYDATRTVEAFSARLRDQVDLDTLVTELLAVVDQTVQPAKASLWLRPAASSTSTLPRG